MIKHLMMPLNKHFDDGFGAVGNAFQEAGDQLRKTSCEAGVRWLHGHLPINYLYRHAIELYLKSMITVAHRRLRLPSANGTYNPVPEVSIGGKWKSIYTVHSIRCLYDEMKRVFVTYHGEIAKIAKTDWSAIPIDLESWITTIERADPMSTAFRYPVSKDTAVDAQKSSFKAVDIEELSKRMDGEGPRQCVILTVDDNDDVVESFALDDNPLPELREALVHAVEMLSGAQFGVLMELVGSVSD